MRRRQRQRGQVIILVGLMSTVLIAATALAVDLGVQINDQRHLQNVADSAALSGAVDLPGTSCEVDNEYTAVTDALRSIDTTMGWTSDTWWSAVLKTPSALGLDCTAPYTTTASGALQYGQYVVTASSPPATPRDASYNSAHYLEVNIAERVGNSFAGIMGFATSGVRVHAVAYHEGPAAPTGFALYSATGVATGNYPEEISGDVYVGTALTIQSTGGGHGQFCAETDSLAPGGGGHIILSHTAATSATPPTVTYATNTCSGASGQSYAGALADTPPNPNAASKPCTISGQSADCGAMSQPAPPSSLYCPNIVGVTWWNQSSTLPQGYCVAYPNVSAPTLPIPGCTSYPCVAPPASLPQVPSCTLPGSGIAPGVYLVTLSDCPASGGGLSVSGSVSCASFVVEGGVPINFTGKKGGTITSFGDPSCSSYQSGLTAAQVNADRTLFYEYDTPEPSPNTANNCATKSIYCFNIDGPGNTGYQFTLDGTIYTPAYEFDTTSNAIFTINGAAIVGYWNDQSGNQPNILISYNPNDVPNDVEALKLVE